MNPDKLFDYLDGKLSDAERATLEERFMNEPELRRELAVARQIHSQMGDSREIVGFAEAIRAAAIPLNLKNDSALDDGGRDDHPAQLIKELPLFFAGGRLESIEV